MTLDEILQRELAMDKAKADAFRLMRTLPAHSLSRPAPKAQASTTSKE